MRNTDIFLREKGIKPSYQRKRIFEYMVENRIHPTVNDIYAALIDDIPTLSKATVYNTMNLFHDNGLIVVIPIEGHEARFDIRPETPHSHFKCDFCQTVFDIDVNISQESLLEKLEGNRILTQNINFTGICAQCLSEDDTAV